MCAQNGFYLGAGSITTIAQLTDQNNYYEKDHIDFGLYYGNNFKISDKIITTLEVFYLNQEVVLAKTRDSKFRSTSVFTTRELEEFSVLQLTLQYNLF